MIYTVEGIYTDNDQLWAGEVDLPEDSSVDDILKNAYDQVLVDNDYNKEEEDREELETLKAKNLKEIDSESRPRMRFVSIYEGRPRMLWSSDYYTE